MAPDLVLVAWAALYVLSTPLHRQPAPAAAASRATSIPCPTRPARRSWSLGGGTYFEAPEYGGDTVNAITLVRLRYAAHLYRLLEIPVLAAGGRPSGNATPEAGGR